VRCLSICPCGVGFLVCQESSRWWVLVRREDIQHDCKLSDLAGKLEPLTASHRMCASPHQATNDPSCLRSCLSVLPPSFSPPFRTLSSFSEILTYYLTIKARRPAFTPILRSFCSLDLSCFVARSSHALPGLNQLIRCAGPTYSKQACYLPDAEVRPEKIPESDSEKFPEKTGKEDGRRHTKSIKSKTHGLTHPRGKKR